MTHLRVRGALQAAAIVLGVLATGLVPSSVQAQGPGSVWLADDVSAVDLGTPNCLRRPRVNGFGFAPDGRPLVGWTQVEGCGGSTRTFWAEKAEGQWTTYPWTYDGFWSSPSGAAHEFGLGQTGDPYLFMVGGVGSSLTYWTFWADLRAFAAGDPGALVNTGEHVGNHQECVYVRYRLATDPTQPWPARATRRGDCGDAGPLRYEGANLVDYTTSRAHDVTIGPDGRAHLAYVDNGGQVFYVRPGLPPVPVATVVRNSDDLGLAVSADGAIHLVVRGFSPTADYDRGLVGYLRSTDDGATWTLVDHVDQSRGTWGLSLQLDAGGRPAVALWRYGSLVYLSRASGAWVESRAALLGWDGVEWLAAPRLRFDGAGVPHIAYYDWSANRIRVVSPAPAGVEAPVDLRVTGAAAPTPTVPGTRVSYTLSVTNQAAREASGVRVQVTLPPGASVTNAVPAPLGNSGGVLTFDRWRARGELQDRLGPLTTGTIAFELTGLTVGEPELAVTVTSTEPEAEPTDNSAVVRARIYEASCALPASARSAWWPGDGTALNYGSGPAYHGTVAGGVTYGPGAVGHAFHLDGATGRIEVNNGYPEQYWPGTSPLSVAAWFATSVSSSDPQVIASHEDLANAPCCGSPQGHAAWYLFVRDGVVRASLRENPYGSATVALAGTTPVADGAFHHAALVIDIPALEARLYVDGSHEASAPLRAGWTMSNGDFEAEPLVIGAAQVVWGTGYRYFFSGAIDDVSLYKRVLTATEIADAASGPARSECRPPEPPPSITPPGDQTNAEGDDVSLQLEWTAGAGKTIAFLATGLPPGLSIGLHTGLISGTLTMESAGTHEVTVTVSDGVQDVSTTFTWTVTAVSRPTLLLRAGPGAILEVVETADTCVGGEGPSVFERTCAIELPAGGYTVQGTTPLPQSMLRWQWSIAGASHSQNGPDRVSLDLAGDAQVGASLLGHFAVQRIGDAALGRPGTVTSTLPPYQENAPGFTCPADRLLCEGFAPLASTVTLTAEPVESNVFGSWGGACAGTQPTCDLLIDPLAYLASGGTTLVEARFEPRRAEVRVTAGPGLIVTATGSTDTCAGGDVIDLFERTCTFELPVGTAQLRAQKPISHGETRWSVGGVSVGVGENYEITVPASAADLGLEIKATFFSPFAVLIGQAPSGTASSVTSTMPTTDFSCDTERCLGLAPALAPVTLTAVPGGQAVFGAWGGACSGTEPSCSLVVDPRRVAPDTGFQVVTAEFEPLRVPVTVVAGPGLIVTATGGADTCAGGDVADFFERTCTFQLPVGTAELHAQVPFEASEPRWTVAGTLVSTNRTFAFPLTEAAIAQHLEVAVRLFVPIGVRIEQASSGAPGLVTATAAGVEIPCDSVHCEGPAPFLSSVALAATAGDGTRFVGWSGACTGAEPACSFVADPRLAVEGQSLQVVTATFEPYEPPLLGAPGDQASGEGEGVALQLTWTAGEGKTVAFLATGLPPGLSIGRHTGLISGTLPMDAAGTYAVTVTISDGVQDSSATLTWVVRDVNQHPEASDDVLTIEEDAPTLTIPAAELLANDTDPDGDGLSIIAIGGSANGRARLREDGHVDFTPDPDFNGVASFVYDLSDGRGGWSAANVRVTVTPVNDPPVLAGQVVEVESGAPLRIALGATDVDGDALRALITSLPSHGTAAVDGDAIVYTSAPDFAGTDQLEVTIDDGRGGSAAASIRIDVTAPNQPPLLDNVKVETAEDTPVSLTLLGSDPEGEALSYAIVQAAATGTASLAGNELTYSPSPNFNGTDIVGVEARDGRGGAIRASVTFTVTPVNDPPTFRGPIPDVNVLEDAAPYVVFWPDYFSDPDGDHLTLSATSGKVTLAGARVDESEGALEVSFVPDANGSTELTVVATDPSGAQVATRFRVTVEPVNDAPVARDDVAFTFQGVPLTIAAAELLANDTDIDGDALAVVAVGKAANGGVVLAGGQVTFTPSPGFLGSASFSYSASDGHGGQDSATVAVSVLNRAPVLSQPIPDISALEDAGPRVIRLADHFSDPDGEALTFSASSGNTNLLTTAVDNAARTLTLAFVANASGATKLRVVATDPSGASIDAVVNVTVAPVNDAPSFASPGPLVLTAARDFALALAGLSPGPGEAAQSLTLRVISNEIVGAVTNGTAAGNWTYVVSGSELRFKPPLRSAAADTTLTIEVSDDGGTADGGRDRTSVTVNVRVEGVPLVTIDVVESIVVTDAVAAQPAVVIAIQESITITDGVDMPNTPTGNDVRVTFAVPPVSPRVTVKFAAVTQPGTTYVYPAAWYPPAPSGYAMGEPPLVVEVTTTAQYGGDAEVCVSYDAAAYKTANQRLMHHDGTQWKDTTTSNDRAQSSVCGTAASFSPFAVMELAPATGFLAGRMSGSGTMTDSPDTQHWFHFSVSEGARRSPPDRLLYVLTGTEPVAGPAVRSGRGDGDRSHHQKRRRSDRFEATRFEWIRFNDDPGVRPGRRRSGAVADSVMLAGGGTWNGKAGYTFEARAEDRGEPGRGRDRFALTVRSPQGDVVAAVDGVLDAGNIQSVEVGRR